MNGPNLEGFCSKYLRAMIAFYHIKRHKLDEELTIYTVVMKISTDMEG
jgi:hypothetical protein